MNTNGQPKMIAFVLYPGLTPLDLIGPLQVMNSKGPDYLTVVVGETLDPLPTDTPLKMMADKTFEEVAHPDILIVPGGGIPTYQAMANTTLRDYLVSASETATLVGSVCTGALILAAAGLLDGRRATTHWAHWQTLENLGAHYVKQRWVEDGKFITSAGVSAGIDMALHLLCTFGGEAMARQAQLGLEYEPEPPLGPIEWSKVDRNQLYPQLKPMLPALFANRHDLLSKLNR